MQSRQNINQTRFLSLLRTQEILGNLQFCTWEDVNENFLYKTNQSKSLTILHMPAFGLELCLNTNILLKLKKKNSWQGHDSAALLQLQ